MLEKLMQESDDFHAAMETLRQSGPPIAEGELRFVVSAVSATLSIEHSAAARLCFAGELASSATAMVRLQYEATVRSAWLLHVATDEEIRLIDGPLDTESDSLARKIPGATTMLKAVTGRAPDGLTVPLQQFHDVTWHRLNSFVRAGIHPIRRQSEGCPVLLACQMLRNANAILHVTYRMLAALTGSAAAMSAVTNLWKTHGHCLPIDPDLAV
ncbi:hypothetical protein [Xanthomonas sp. NCPPB 2632]|uniref:DUF6988 family protein n=1 Tax=Xanthomonas sp. NCPPB 2632 TaxID=3240912 RepID=UPI00351644F4